MSYKFKNGDRFVSASGDVGTVLRIAVWDEFGCDFYVLTNNYVVEFDTGDEHAMECCVSCLKPQWKDDTLRFNYVIDKRSMVTM